MTGLFKAAAVVAVFAVVAPANAAPLPPLNGSYAGSYETESVNTGFNLHTFWLPNLLDGASSYWQFDTAGGSFNYDGSTAKLTGTIVNNTDSTKKFDVDVNLNFTQKGGRTAKCELGGACSSLQYANQENFFEYFSYGSATLTGLGMLAGLLLDLTEAPADGKYPPQLGYGANNKNIDEFGLSTWFFWNTTGTNAALKNASGQGDINIELTPVPVPAALPLLAGGLGLMTFMGWRRRKMQS
ncbi:hypothetical protein IWQ49_002883 [Labrenzia sp. EL_126]|nr:hypothetical protein [Labrenzia sp. EL_126]